MLGNVSTSKKLMFFPLIFILIVFLAGAIFGYFDAKVEKTYKSAIQTEVLIENVLKGRIAVYQFLRAPNNQSASKVRNSFSELNKKVTELKSNLTVQKNRELCDDIIQYSNQYINLFDNFADNRINEYSNGIKDESSNIKSEISKMASVGGDLERKLNEINKSAIAVKNDAISSLDTALLILAIISIIIFMFISFMISKMIISSISDFKNGLNSFFSYLNKETNTVSMLNDKNTDEFGQMAKDVNNNINKTKIAIEEDRRLIDNTISILANFEKGDLSGRITSNVSNQSLQQLRDVINKMADNFEKNIQNILRVLNEYSAFNYMNKVETASLQKHLLELATGVNNLGDSITTMLSENKANGLTLDKSSNILLTNVDKLNNSSNEAAASLEETAAALEEITSNIRNNTENIVKMSKLSQGVTSSANNGEKLANQTTVAMEDINTQVTSINEAIAVIDQIAFQTNILSLNAAVEAATAGEAGKGFAVVAGEVRNLATRSAEAAKEIKDLVESATNKADEGKQISANMINGYKELNDNISHTLTLIQDIEMASREQLQGIEQINDAVTELDRQTQENANVASQTHEVAVITDEIAKLVVKDADSKSFKGKENIKAKEINIQEQKHQYVPPVKKGVTRSNTPKPTPSNISKPTTKVEPKIITSKPSKDDEWESF